jgi:hypothetical protein
MPVLPSPTTGPQVHDVGDRLEAVKGLLESQGFAVELEAGLPGNWLVFGMR